MKLQEECMPTNLSLFKIRCHENNRRELEETNFQDVMSNLRQIISNCSAPDKPALVVDVSAVSYKGIDPYDGMTVHIDIIPGNKVDLYFKEAPIREAHERAWDEMLKRRLNGGHESKLQERS